MATLARIAAGYGVQPMELATLVGLGDTDPDAELGAEQTARVINAADASDFFGVSVGGRHRFRVRSLPA